MNKITQFTIGILTALLLPTTAFTEENTEKTPLDKARAAMNATSKSAERAEIARDTAFNAVENAMAVQDDAEANLIKAIKENDKKKIYSFKKILKTSANEAEDARDLLEKVVKYTSESISAYDSTKETFKIISRTESKKEIESLVGKNEKLANAAEKAVRKAEHEAETLKKKWLIPVILTTSTSSTTGSVQKISTPQKKK